MIGKDQVVCYSHVAGGGKLRRHGKICLRITERYNGIPRVGQGQRTVGADGERHVVAGVVAQAQLLGSPQYMESGRRPGCPDADAVVGVIPEKVCRVLRDLGPVAEHDSA